MSDFVQTMKDWKRMCSAMEKLRPDDSCNGCMLEGYSCPAIYEDDYIDYDDVEKQVTKWAAEHPEPVYPSVYEWLVSMGLLGSDMWSASDLQKPIPADIAEKLGIEPKEA